MSFLPVFQAYSFHVPYHLVIPVIAQWADEQTGHGDGDGDYTWTSTHQGCLGYSCC